MNKARSSGEGRWRQYCNKHPPRPLGVICDTRSSTVIDSTPCSCTTSIDTTTARYKVIRHSSTVLTSQKVSRVHGGNEISRLTLALCLELVPPPRIDQALSQKLLQPAGHARAHERESWNGGSQRVQVRVRQSGSKLSSTITLHSTQYTHKPPFTICGHQL